MSEAARTIDGVEAPATGTWVLDPSHTSAGFVARHAMVSKIRGRFREVSGALEVGETPEESSAEVSIQAASIETNDEQRDGHLRSPDFLDVDKFPTISFKSTRVELSGERGLTVEGDLTIRDVTRPVVLQVEYEGLAVDPFGIPRVGFSASTEIEREDFGMAWNQALEAGGWLVGKRVRIEVEAEAVPKAVAEAMAG